MRPIAITSTKPELFGELLKQAIKTFPNTWITTEELARMPLRRCQGGAKLIDLLFHRASSSREFPQVEVLEKWLDWHRGIEVDGLALVRSLEAPSDWRVVRAKPAPASIVRELDELLSELPDE
jgi:hypothetical protein